MHAHVAENDRIYCSTVQMSCTQSVLCCAAVTTCTCLLTADGTLSLTTNNSRSSSNDGSSTPISGSSPLSSIDSINSLASISDSDGSTIAERLQQQYEQAQQGSSSKPLTGVEQREQRRKSYMEQVGQVSVLI